MTARMVMLAARVGLFVAVIGLCSLAVAPPATVEAVIGPISGAQHFTAFYVLMMLAMAAFPKGRRNDACAALVVFGTVIEVLRESMGAPRDLSEVGLDAAGVLAVYAPTYLEVLRLNMRTYPAGAPFARHFAERRRSF